MWLTYFVQEKLDVSIGVMAESRVQLIHGLAPAVPLTDIF